MKTGCKLWIVLFAVVGSSHADEFGELHPPVQVLVGGEPIDVERSGHAAPWFGDLDGDGIRDLLVGQYEDGKLRVYRNFGTNSDPLFQRYDFLQVANRDISVPFG